MQFTWNIAQGVSSYNKQTGFGFVIGAVYNANAALRIPETNSSFLPQWWYAGTAICDVTCTEYGVQATATDAVRAEDLECRSLPVWFRVDVPAGGCLPYQNYRDRYRWRGSAGIHRPPPSCLARYTGSRGEQNHNSVLRCVSHRAARAGRCRAKYRCERDGCGGRTGGGSGGRSPGCPPHLGVR